MRHAIEAERVEPDDVKVGVEGTPAPVYRRIFKPFAEASSRISPQSVSAFNVAEVLPIFIMIKTRSAAAMLPGSVTACDVPAVLTDDSAVDSMTGKGTQRHPL
jgi:hypothetical protein